MLLQKFQLLATCSYGEICTKVEEEWPIYQAIDYQLLHQGKEVLEAGWGAFVQSLPASTAVKLTVMPLGKSFSKYTKTGDHDNRELMRRVLGVEPATPVAVIEVDEEFPAHNLPPDDTLVSGGITIGVLLDTLALQMVHKLAAMGEVNRGTEFTNMEYIGPVLVTAVVIVLAIRPDVGGIKERLLLHPEQAMLGKLAWGPVDYVIFYRLFMIVVAEAKRIDLGHAWAQHIMQMAAARDTLARQVEHLKKEHSAGRKQSFWEMSELDDVPTNGILSTGEHWILTRFKPMKNNKPAEFISGKTLKLCLIPAVDCTVTKLLPELRVLLARIVQMLLSQSDVVDTAQNDMAPLENLTQDPTAPGSVAALEEATG